MEYKKGMKIIQYKHLKHKWEVFILSLFTKKQSKQGPQIDTFNWSEDCFGLHFLQPAMLLNMKKKKFNASISKYQSSSLIITSRKWEETLISEPKKLKLLPKRRESPKLLKNLWMVSEMHFLCKIETFIDIHTRYISFV